MKTLPAVAHRVSIEKSMRMKKTAANVFDRLLIESQSIGSSSES